VNKAKLTERKKDVNDYKAKIDSELNFNLVNLQR
jgi:hypothetical protein